MAAPKRDHTTGRILPLDPKLSKLLARDYASGKKMQFLADRHKLNISTVHRHVHAHGVEPRPLGQRYFYNKNAFDSLTEEAAYWAGFLMADGCITEGCGGTKVVAVGLKASDKLHLQKLKKFLQSTHPVTIVPRWDGPGGYGGGDRAVLRVHSNELALSLKKYGVVPRKSLIARATGGAESNRHFWRGVVDGDGSVSSPSANRLQVSLVSGGKTAQQFAMFIKSSIGINGRIDTRRKSNRHAFLDVATYVGIDAARVADFLYSNQSISLDRKNDNAKWWLNVFAPVLSGERTTLPKGSGWRSRKQIVR